MVGRNDGPSMAISVRQELWDMNREEGVSWYGLKSKGMNFLALFVHQKESNCLFLKSVLEAWLGEIPLSLMRNLIYMHNNASSHAAEATTQYLECLGFKT